MIEQTESPASPCPTEIDLGRVVMGDDDAVLEHVASCRSCTRSYAEIVALDNLLDLAAGLVFAGEAGAAPGAECELGEANRPHLVRQHQRTWGRPGLRAAGIAVVVLLGMATMVGEGVVPIATPGAASWRGTSLDAIDAAARWSAVTGTLEISWLRRAGDEVFVVRVWRSDGVLLVKTSTPEDRVRFDATDWLEDHGGALLWSVAVWANGEQVATSTLREIGLNGEA